MVHRSLSSNRSLPLREMPLPLPPAPHRRHRPLTAAPAVSYPIAYCCRSRCCRGKAAAAQRKLLGMPSCCLPARGLERADALQAQHDADAQAVPGSAHGEHIDDGEACGSAEE